MQKFQNTIFWAIVASESSHVFCCVLPTIFSILSLLAGVGMAGVPVWLQDIHEVLHRWEVPMILASGVVLALGWGLYFYSKKIDCHDTGCGHGPCAPRKNTTGFVLKAATVLFILNIAIWGVFHRGMGILMPHAEALHAEHRHGQ